MLPNELSSMRGDVRGEWCYMVACPGVCLVALGLKAGRLSLELTVNEVPTNPHSASR